MSIRYKDNTVANVGSGPTYTGGDGITVEGNVINSDNPMRGIISREEYDALSEEQKNKGTYIIPEKSNGSSAGGTVSEEIYSSEETRIGTWVDGRPLYRKTVAIVTPNSDGGQHIVYEDDDDNKPVNIYGYFISTGLDYIPLNMPAINNASSSIYCGWYGQSKYIMAVVGAGYRGRNGYLTIEYVKTTDTATLQTAAVQTLQLEPDLTSDSMAACPVSAANTVEVSE